MEKLSSSAVKCPSELLATCKVMWLTSTLQVPTTGVFLCDLSLCFKLPIICGQLRGNLLLDIHRLLAFLIVSRAELEGLSA